MTDINKALKAIQREAIVNFINKSGVGNVINADDPKVINWLDETNTEAIAKIKALVVDSIGEDDIYNEMCEHCNNWDEGRNDLRGEIRSIYESK